ncbi:MAG: DMT family transporter [Muribaculaceae bacterium]|nr:DMT family transporter [Muribaculaceae bacterium]
MAENKFIARQRLFKLLAHAGALLTMGAWGSSFLCTKVLMADGGFTPVEMFVYRFAVAYLLLLLITFKHILSNNWKDEFQFFICGLCAGSLYFVTENYALKNTTAGNVSLLVAISPIFTAVLISVIYKTKMKFGVILGSIIAFIGVGCVIFSNGEGFEIRPAGDILALIASLSWSIYTVTVKRLSPIYTSLFITRKIFFYGVITAIPLLFIQREPLHFLELINMAHPEYTINFIFLVVFCSVCAYLIWNEVMKILGSVTANNYLYLQPVVTMIAAYFVLGEVITLLGYIGCVMIVGGLIVSDKLKLKGEK